MRFLKRSCFLGQVLSSTLCITNRTSGNGRSAPKLPITFLPTFAAGALRVELGCPPFSGFFSKDAILAVAYEHNLPIFAVALFTAFLTAFYVIRMLVIVFFGNPRTDSAREGRESPPVMTTPLIVLAILATLGGFAAPLSNFLTLPTEKEAAVFVPVLAIIALILGVRLAIALYRRTQLRSGQGRVVAPQVLLRRVLWLADLLDAGRVSLVWQPSLIAGSSMQARWAAESRDLGIGALLRLIQVGNLSSVHVPLWSRCSRSHLLCSYALLKFCHETHK